jgi:hypothetical protein
MITKSTYDRYHKDYQEYKEAFEGKKLYEVHIIERRMFELIDCLDYDDNKGKLDPLTKHRKDQLKEALRNEN